MSIRFKKIKFCSLTAYMVLPTDRRRDTPTGNLRGRARITFITNKRARGKTKTPNRHNHTSVPVKVVVIAARNTEKNCRALRKMCCSRAFSALFRVF